MAATTPTPLQPYPGSTAIPLEGPVDLQWSLYAGAGALAYQRVIIYSDAGGTVQVWDSLWMAPGEPGWADGRLRIDAGRLAPTSGGARWWKVAAKNDVPETSLYSALTAFTHAVAKLTGAGWIGAQP